MKTIPLFTILVSTLAVLSCKKDATNSTTELVTPPSSATFGYGDSIFYVKANAYVVAPTSTRPGTYSAFPDNLNMDPATGRITVSVRDKAGEATQTGLRYRIVFTPTEGKADTTYIVLAGITYQDRIYYMDQNETKVSPIHNATPTPVVPGGRNFRASDNDVVIDRATGQIDMERTLANGFLGNEPEDDDWDDVTITYENQDGSSNSLEVIIYYYTSVNNIPSNVSGAMKAHQNLLLGIAPAAIPDTYAPVDESIKDIVSISKPRPPCIILIGK